MSFVSRALPYALALYTVAVLTTMAGMEIFAWLSFVLTLVVLIGDRRWIKRPILEKSDWAFIVLMVVIILSALIAAPATSDKVFIIGNARFVPLFIALRFGLEFVGLQRMESFFRFLVVLIGLISAYTIFQHFTGIDYIRGHREPVSKVFFENSFAYRGRGMWGHPVTFGHSMALSFCMVTAYAVTLPTKSRWRWIATAVSILSALSLLWSYTRGAWIGVAAAVAIMTMYLGRRIAILAASSGTAALILAVSLSSNFRARLLSVVSLTDTSNTQRLDVWKANIAMFLDHPILGVGYGVNEEIIGDYYAKLGIVQEFGGHAHNNYLQFLAGTGLLGFFAFLSATALLLWMSHRLLREIPRSEFWPRALVLGALGAQIALHFGGLTECNFKDAEVNHQYMLILAILTVAWRSRDTNSASHFA